MRPALKMGVSALVLASVAAIGSAKAADLPVAAPFEPAVAPALFSWTGFYVGGHVGVAWHDRDHADLCDSIVSARDKVGEPIEVECEGLGLIADGPDEGLDVRFIDLDGDYIAVLDRDGDDDNHELLAGAQAGFNWQSGKFVIGVEADVSYLGWDDDDDQELKFQYFHSLFTNTAAELGNFEGEGSISIGQDIEWLATVRGRAGLALGAEGRFLPYVTAGVAFAGVENEFSATFSREGGVDWCDGPGGCTFADSDDDEDDDVKVGLAVGGGIEFALSNNISIGLEYLGYFFDDDDDSREVTFLGDREREITFDLDEGGLEDIHTVRGKVNFRFAQPAPAIAPEVTTRY